MSSRTCRSSATDTGDSGLLLLLSPSHDSLTNTVNRQYLPEAFLWDTFYHLVEAAVAMRDGPRKGEWGFEFVHRDIKPGNSKIFCVGFSNCAARTK